MRLVLVFPLQLTQQNLTKSRRTVPHISSAFFGENLSENVRILRFWRRHVDLTSVSFSRAVLDGLRFLHIFLTFFLPGNPKLKEYISGNIVGVSKVLSRRTFYLKMPNDEFAVNPKPV